MLDTKTFLTRVFAQQDELVICVHKPDPSGQNPRGIFWNRGSFTDLDAAVAAIHRWDAEPNTTVYFGVGAFAGHEYQDQNGRTKWTRKQEQATQFKALALDLDIGTDKPYATQREGWTAMLGALRAIGLPMPMVISSGRGIHCYWPLTAPVSTAHWVKASTALRLALEDHKVVIDTSKVHDPSMVLRPVGTHHKKQAPWKPVACMSDCPDYDPVALFTVLKPWFGRVAARPGRPNAAARPQSAIAAAVLNTNDVVLDVVAQQCRQVGALVASGGVTDAAGNAVAEPLWRASLGLASRCTDVKDAIIKIAGQHPDFDLQASMDKATGWRGTAPTCEKLAQLCPGGCEGCPQRGKIKSPATLTASATIPMVADTGEVVATIDLPDRYVMRDNKIWLSDEVDSNETDGNGNAVKVTEYELISPYLMHITSFYKDEESGKTTFRLAVKYPMSGWLEEDHDAGCIASVGKDFSTFLLHRQVFGIKSIGHQEKLRSFLMDYLSLVQSQAPSGVDYVAFGWQDDGSFLCGETVIGSPSGHTDRRLRGPAAEFAEVIKPHGTRDGWVDAMQMLNHAGTDTMRSAVLLSTAGILGPTAGNASMVVSIYSTETTTGKSLALIAANSLIGSPRELFMGKNDTANSTFKVRGVLNNLPCTIDELTSMADENVADLAYDLSQGQEKRALTKDRELRKRAKWAGPTLVTTNISLHQKIEAVQANNDPLKARVLELHQHDRAFVQTDALGSSHGYRFYDMVAENNGWAFPELVEAVVAAGGPKAVWQKGEAAFMRKFGFIFEPQERFYRTGIIAAWIMGKIGGRLGLFPFDVDGTITHLLQHVVSFRKQTLTAAVDVFDTIGQFLQEHNDRLIEVSELHGSGKEQVRMPAPENAVARLKLVQDAAGAVCPGSQLAINLTYFRHWLSRSRDGVDRIARQLESQGGLLAERDRVTLFKGCPGRNPGQAMCIVVNMNHPRFVAAITGTMARQQSPVLLNVLQGQQ